MRGFKFRAWDGDDSISHKDGEYIYVKAEWHPYKNKRGYVKRHRLVLEKKLGYYIPKRSIVHHKDKNKRNDHPDNLELTPNQSLHAKSHDVSKRNTNGQFVANDPYFKEIKFRLYNKHTQQYEIYDLSKLIRTTFRNSQFTFAGRCTGLKDRKGNEIYEGDILATSNDGKDGSDIWTQKDWGFGLVTLDIISGLHVQGWASDLQDENSVFALRYVYVVGNIYQDKHLLK